MTGLTENSPVVVVCSVNRAAMLHESLESVLAGTMPCRIVVSVPDLSHVLEATRQLPGVTVATGPQGSSRQRNRALRSIEGRPEAILFLDDDVECEPHYVERMIEAFRAHSEAAIVNGRNLAFGLYPAGSLDREKARELIRGEVELARPQLECRPAATAYGCLMALRGNLLGRVWFDERLPLYGFLEDHDFYLRARPFGTVLENPNAWMVHIEALQGRTGDYRRGYSEVVNPFYIHSKNVGLGLKQAFLGSANRTLRSLKLGLHGQGFRRLGGNLRGWLQVALGRPDPEKILHF